MPTINDYLAQKKEAMIAIQSAIASGRAEPSFLRADATIRGGSGLRSIRVRDHHIISDAPPAMAGYDLGPNAPELMLSALASCLAHTLAIQAALNDLKIDSATVSVTAKFDIRAKTPGFEDIPVEPHDIDYVIEIVSPSDADKVKCVVGLIEEKCPLYNLIVNKQDVKGSLKLTTS